MTQTQQQFFEDAIRRSGAINASSLARKIGVDRSSLSGWKNGRDCPSDTTMLKIAMICELDPVEALALLNLWRCDDAAKSTYERLLHVAQSTALRCFPYIGALMLASQANIGNLFDNNALADTPHVQISHKVSLYHHYAIFKETFYKVRAHVARHFNRTCIMAHFLQLLN